MMLLAPLDLFIDLLSKNTGFWQFTGAADAAAALSHIYRDFLPEPADKNEHTLAELQAMRPFAMVWQSESNGWHARRNAATSCFKISGMIVVRFEWDVPYAPNENDQLVQSGSDQAAATTFQEHLSRILHNDDSTGILNICAQMNITDVMETACFRSPPEHYKTIGDCYAAEFLIAWGVK